MSIVSSIIASQITQRDGRISITEKHVDHTGVAYFFIYLAPADSDVNAALIARVETILDQLRDDDLNRCIFLEAWNYTLVHATNAELAAFVRAAYRNASKDTLAVIAKRILEWITNGRFTETQIRNAFGLTTTQWTTLKTKMQNLVANYSAVQAAEGE